MIIDPDYEITFHNVTITLPMGMEEGAAKAAYDRLCNALAEIGAEWSTDTYSVSHAPELGEMSTEDLFNT